MPAKKVAKRRQPTKSKKLTVATSRKSAATVPAPRKVTIEVALPAAESGLSAFSDGEMITSENVTNYLPAQGIQESAARLLQDLGFRVLALSPHSISIEGTPALFTRTFGTRLHVRSFDRVQNGLSFRKKEFYAPVEGATWELPNQLRGFVERAYVQTPATYFELAMPPSVPYSHLKGPGDIAMLTRASEAHKHGLTGQGVRVVMVDSGFFNHQFYQANGLRAAVVLAPGALNATVDKAGHGTAHAINAFATAPGINFTMVKMGISPTLAFKTAMSLSPQVIICSWGLDMVVPGSPNRKHLTTLTGDAAQLAVEVSNAVRLGVCVVSASGNREAAFPGMHPDVISAGGVFVEQNLNMRAADLASAYASKPYPGRHVPDVCGLVGMRPAGAYIMCPVQPTCDMDRNFSGGAFPNRDMTAPNDGWVVVSGTSAAAPQIAGICALLKQKHPSLTPLQIKQVLIEGAVDCTRGAANPESNEGTALQAGVGPDGATGHGLVNAAASLARV